ncbi:SoxR reducing system RseC family protein [Anaerococcus degeneri]|uniref:SoxR reducing system RseC family protein n=1 Tax=Anaerococcus degeneri TaxID=361500 RepID=A0ABS7YZQ9_9FIRM|nr:SoxR reducing system RseC family protein [Anaerococcus degeneri]MBP2015002.1 sigma-E factor negative regulatory protein RseC [Anaerococcus degeneri]MCA2097210.1 SoxR reducing system RseC family protein [Anaerococcus degeneri]
MAMTKEGLVLENNNGNLKIKVDRNAACGSCAASGSCAERKTTIIEIFSADDINKGDKVILESDADEISKISALVYVVPVILVMIGALVPSFLLKNSGYDTNLISLGSVILMLVLSVLYIKRLDKGAKKENLMKVRKIY